MPDELPRQPPEVAPDHHSAGPVGLSVIVPTYNEQASIRLLYDRIAAAVEPMGRTFEIIFVDDGSQDHTFTNCAAIAAADPRVRVIKFRRNHGQTAAMAAGIDHAAGRILVTMDGDLQNDPADIPLLVARIEAGHDLVVGWRHRRQDKALSRKLPSVIANWLIGKVTGVPIKDNGCSLKAYRADLIKRIPLYSEMHRFIPAMSSLAKPRIDQIKVRHHARQFGKSKYGLSRTYKVLIDLITIKTILVFARQPLFWFVGAAAVPGLLCLVFLGIAVAHAAPQTGSPTIVYGSIAVLFGSLSVFLALIGMIGYLIFQVAREPRSEASFLGLIGR